MTVETPKQPGQEYADWKTPHTGEQSPESQQELKREIIKQFEEAHKRLLDWQYDTPNKGTEAYKHQEMLGKFSLQSLEWLRNSIGTGAIEKITPDILKDNLKNYEGLINAITGPISPGQENMARHHEMYAARSAVHQHEEIRDPRLRSMAKEQAETNQERDRAKARRIRQEAKQQQIMDAERKLASFYLKRMQEAVDKQPVAYDREKYREALEVATQMIDNGLQRGEPRVTDAAIREFYHRARPGTAGIVYGELIGT